MFLAARLVHKTYPSLTLSVSVLSESHNVIGQSLFNSQVWHISRDECVHVDRRIMGVEQYSFKIDIVMSSLLLTCLSSTRSRQILA